MKGNDKIIKQLNTRLAEELTAINQYMVHAEMCENWKYGHLNETIEKRAIAQMKHAEMAHFNRILFLEGRPAVSNLNQIKIGPEVREIHKNDLDSEYAAVHGYTTASASRASLGTTVPARYSKRSCTTRKSTLIGSRRSSTRSSRQASRTTLRSRYAK